MLLYHPFTTKWGLMFVGFFFFMFWLKRNVFTPFVMYMLVKLLAYFYLGAWVELRGQLILS